MRHAIRRGRFAQIDSLKILWINIMMPSIKPLGAMLLTCLLCVTLAACDNNFDDSNNLNNTNNTNNTNNDTNNDNNGSSDATPDSDASVDRDESDDSDSTDDMGDNDSDATRDDESEDDESEDDSTDDMGDNDSDSTDDMDATDDMIASDSTDDMEDDESDDMDSTSDMDSTDDMTDMSDMSPSGSLVVDCSVADPGDEEDTRCQQCQTPDAVMDIPCSGMGTLTINSEISGGGMLSGSGLRLGADARASGSVGVESALVRNTDNMARTLVFPVSAGDDGTQRLRVEQNGSADAIGVMARSCPAPSASTLRKATAYFSVGRCGQDAMVTPSLAGQDVYIWRNSTWEKVTSPIQLNNQSVVLGTRPKDASMP